MLKITSFKAPSFLEGFLSGFNIFQMIKLYLQKDKSELVSRYEKTIKKIKPNK